MVGTPTAAQVTERVMINRLLRALPRVFHQVVGMWNPTTTLELVEMIELAEAAHRREAGERVPPFPRRVAPEQRAPEGISRPISRPPTLKTSPCQQRPLLPKLGLGGQVVGCTRSCLRELQRPRLRSTAGR